MLNNLSVYSCGFDEMDENEFRLRSIFSTWPSISAFRTVTSVTRRNDEGDRAKRFPSDSQVWAGEFWQWTVTWFLKLSGDP